MSQLPKVVEWGQRRELKQQMEFHSEQQFLDPTHFAVSYHAAIYAEKIKTPQNKKESEINTQMSKSNKGEKKTQKETNYEQKDWVFIFTLEW